MNKILTLIFCFITLFAFPNKLFAQNSNSFVSIVNPVRSNEFWDLKDQKPETSVKEQIKILNKFNIPATWLLRFDALNDDKIISEIKSRTTDDIGLFLEVIPSWSEQSGVKYNVSQSWHAAGSAFLTGYEREERIKLIDKAFVTFKQVFGYYPKSVGAWWMDSYSLDYMQKKYSITAGLIVADQYTTDNYQIWGQYFGVPYYPSNKNALHPAQSNENKIPVVLSQWAVRDPVNGYGNGVFESTFSVQPNDYIDYHKLGTDYFSKLISIYTNQDLNKFGFAVVGLENTYEWVKYGREYENQLNVLAEMRNNGLLKTLTLADFSSWYKSNFPDLSPEHIIVSGDPLGSFKKSVWYMNPYYRAGWFFNSDGSVFRDIRQYIEGEEEICYQKRCSEVNFATFATRVLDEITYGDKWVIDEGRITEFEVIKTSEGFLITYINAAGTKRNIGLLPRDLNIDGKISTIDGAILSAVNKDNKTDIGSVRFNSWLFNWSIQSVFTKSILFLLFIIFFCLLPGMVITKGLYGNDSSIGLKIFLSIIVGFVSLTLVYYFTYLLNLRILLYIYLFINLLSFVKLKYFLVFQIKKRRIGKFEIITMLVIIMGTIFQIIPVVKSGLIFKEGMAFWGPNTHDGVWHISLINQLIKTLPPENPIFADTYLKNYHYFYDLLVAVSVSFTNIPVLDLVFRFFPIVFSLLLGLGTVCLVWQLTQGFNTFRAKTALILSLYFVYFSGSFGWIVEFVKQKTLGGESAFWANQSISFNLNPPFAISLIIVIAFLLLLMDITKFNKTRVVTCILLLSSLIGFKSYGAFLAISSLGVLAIIYAFKKRFLLLFISIFSGLFSLIILLSNFSINQQLIIFSPFWFIHALMDSPDRVGWERLSLARIAGLQTQNWIKFIIAEIIGLILFITGNMGIRIISIASLINIKTILGNLRLTYLLIFTIISFTIPIIFVQSGNPWNTIQFFYYGLYVTAVVSGIVLSSVISDRPKIVFVTIFLVVFLLTPINSITTASYYLGKPHAIIEEGELEALKFLSRQPEGVVLTYPYDSKLKSRIPEPRPLYAYDSTAYVSAFSQKSVYIEDEPQNQILLNDVDNRLVSAKDFFLNPNMSGKEFLENHKIKYIYLPKTYNADINKPQNIKRIFENEKAVIYSVM